MKALAPSRAEITKKLIALEGCMVQLHAKWRRDVDFWPAFADQVDVVTDGVSVDDYWWAKPQIEAILIKHARACSDDIEPPDDKPLR